jgi:hypothetical protein
MGVGNFGDKLNKLIDFDIGWFFYFLNFGNFFVHLGEGLIFFVLQSFQAIELYKTSMY